MTLAPPRCFRIASEDWEFEAIARLNYKTFVEEIPQHAGNGERRLVDRFHAENTYAVCLVGERLVGMVCGRMARPFSLDQKVPDLDRHLPAGRRAIEVRLLAVEKEYRSGWVFGRLVGLLAEHFRALGCDLAVISGTLRQLKLYRHLGFTPFGPLVGGGEARFQPMYLPLETFLRSARALMPPAAAERRPACFLPGPVEVHGEVRQAFAREPVSHRAAAFLADFDATRRLLCELTGAAHVELLLGSGSLANDAVCGQLSLLDAPGLILSNGEFGERLIDHAARQRLDFAADRRDWGEPFDLAALRRRLEARPRPAWLWAVHCETSTGVLNDLAGLKALAAEHGVKLALDCVSSIGAGAVDLRGVYLASCVSGKALASYPGLSMVFHHHELAPAPARLARYLDLGLYAGQGGVPFTTSSNLLYALQAALRRVDWPARFRAVAAAGSRLRGRLRGTGLRIVAPEAHAAPAVVTLELPPEADSGTVGRQLGAAGYLLSCDSGYLRQRNWIQVCLMGEWLREALERLPEVLAGLCAQSAGAARPSAVRPPE